MSRFMQSKNFFNHLRYILTVLNINILKSETPMKLNIHVHLNEKRPLNRKDKATIFILPEILVKMRQ